MCESESRRTSPSDDVQERAEATMDVLDDLRRLTETGRYAGPDDDVALAFSQARLWVWRAVVRFRKQEDKEAVDGRPEP